MLSRAITRRTFTRGSGTQELDRPAQALLEVDRGSIAEDVPGCRHVGPRVANVTGPRRLEAPLDRLVEGAADQLGELVHACSHAGRDVEDLAARVVCVSGQEVRLDDVRDVGEVARLLAVA